MTKDSSTTAQILEEEGAVIKVKPTEANPTPTEYQKKLIAQWHDSGNSGPAPFASDGKELFWMNRAQRRARAKLSRKTR